MMQAWVDSRFDAVSEDRRRELFETYRAMVAEEAAPPPAAVQVRLTPQCRVGLLVPA